MYLVHWTQQEKELFMHICTVFFPTGVASLEYKPHANSYASRKFLSAERRKVMSNVNEYSTLIRLTGGLETTT